MLFKRRMRTTQHTKRVTPFRTQTSTEKEDEGLVRALRGTTRRRPSGARRFSLFQGCRGLFSLTADSLVSRTPRFSPIRPSKSRSALPISSSQAHCHRPSAPIPRRMQILRQPIIFDQPPSLPRPLCRPGAASRCAQMSRIPKGETERKSSVLAVNVEGVPQEDARRGWLSVAREDGD